MSRRGEVEVRFGYTIRDIDRIAQHAANRAFGGALYPPDRLDTAWHGVVEHLYSCAGPPTPLDLHRAGVHAVQQDNQAEFHHHGIHQRDRLGGAHQAPRYAAYWLGQHSTPSPENQIVDRLALMEIWPRLSRLHQEALTALAIYEDRDTAAAAVGASYMTFAQRIHEARRQFFKAWHEHETPSRLWKTDKRAARRPA